MESGPVPLNAFIYTQITPALVRHTLSDDGWTSLDIGPMRLQIPGSDLTRIRSARELARAIAAQAEFWDKDLAALEEKLVTAEESRTATGPMPAVAADEPAKGDEPFGGDDPQLDTKVTRLIEMPETHRREGGEEQ